MFGGGLRVEQVTNLGTGDILVVLGQESKELRAKDSHEEPRRVDATDNPGMVRRGEEVQPIGLAVRDGPLLDRLGVKVHEPRRIPEVFRPHVAKRRVRDLLFPIRFRKTSRSGGAGFTGF